MEFITNVFSALPSMPLFPYVAGGFAFSMLFFWFYKIIGVIR